MISLFSNITEVRKSEEDELTRMWNISNSNPDMHRTVVPIDLWDLEFFNRAGAFYYQHITDGNSYFEPNPDLALGPARAKVEGENLVGIGKFEPEDRNELAGKIRFKVDYGTMRMTSVGFRPTKDGHWGREADDENPELYYFGGQRLLEFSCVHIASNLSAEKKTLESMNSFLLSQIENHPSKAYQSDFKRMISRDGNKTIIIPELNKDKPIKKKSLTSRKMEARRNQLLINSKFLKDA